MRRLGAIALAASAALHALAAAPLYLSFEPVLLAEDPPELDALEDDEEELGSVPIEDLLNDDFAVSIYEERVATSPEVGAPPAEAEVPTDAAAPPMEAPPADTPAEPEVVAVAPPAPEPVPDAPAPSPAPDPIPEPVLTDEERAVVAEMEQGEATADTPTDDDDGEAVEKAERRRTHRWARRAERPARTARHREPCPPPVESIARTGEAHWYVARDIIEFYATNLPELNKLGRVWTWRNEAGELDGFRVGLSRCSVLRQGGLRSGDIVHDINGRRISTVLQAIGAYFALRAEPELTLHVTRRGAPLELSYTIEAPQRKQRRAR